MCIDEKVWVKECQKKFNDVAGKLLLEKGFKKKRNVYYRVTDDELLQVASFGWLNMKNYDIHFDIIPMYAEIYRLKNGPVLTELPARPVDELRKKRNRRYSFEEQLEFFCTKIIEDFENVKSSETLIEYSKECLSLEQEALYAKIKCGRYKEAISFIKRRYNYRIKSEKKKYEEYKNSYIEYTLEERIEDVNENFAQWLLLKAAMERNDVEMVENILLKNTNFNKECLLLEQEALYAKIKCGRYKEAISFIKRRYNYRIKCEKDQYEEYKNSYIEYTLEERIEDVNKIFAQWLLLKAAMERNDVEMVENILLKNTNFNVEVLEKKLKLDLRL